MFVVLAQVAVRNRQQWHQSINIKQHSCGCVNLLLVKGDSLIAVETEILCSSIKEGRQTSLPLSTPHSAFPFARTGVRGKRHQRTCRPASRFTTRVQSSLLLPQRCPLIQQAARGTQALLKHSLDVAQVPYATHTGAAMASPPCPVGLSVYLGIAAGQTSCNRLLSIAGKLAGV